MASILHHQCYMDGELAITHCFARGPMWRVYLVALLLTVVLCGCGGTGLGSVGSGATGTSGSDDDATGAAPSGPVATPVPIEFPSAVSNTSSLPMNLTPVVTSVSSSLSTGPAGFLAKSVATNTSSGIGLATLSDADLADTPLIEESARAACLGAVNLHETIRTAATNDIVLCVLQEIYNDNLDSLFSDKQADVYLNISYPSQYDYLFPATRYHVTATRDDDNRLVNFNAWGCASGGGNYAQSTYVTQTLDTSIQNTSENNYSATSIVASVSGADSTRVDASGNVTFTAMSDGSYIPVFTKKTLNTAMVDDERATSGDAAYVAISEGTYVQTSGTNFSMNVYKRYRISNVYTSGDYRTYIGNGILIDDNDPAASLLQGFSFESTYDLGKIGLGAGVANVIEVNYDFDWLETTPTNENGTVLPYVEGWSSMAPYLAAYTHNPADYSTTPRTASAAFPVSVDNAFTGDAVWNCQSPSGFTSQSIGASAMNRCALLSLRTTHLGCHEIDTHLASIQLVGGASSTDVYLRTDQTGTWTVPSGTDAIFIFTFDGRGYSSNLFGDGSVTLSKDGTSVPLTYAGQTLNVAQGQLSSGTLAAGAYTMTIDSTLTGGASDRTFTFTVVLQ